MKKILAFVAACLVAEITLAAYSDVISFGDSWTDNGNIYSANLGILGEPYFDGNFSNGYMWVEYLAMDLGLAPSLESEVGGQNYAWSGATTLAANAISVTATATEDQVQGYLSDVGGVASGTALYTLWSGVNDNTAVSTANNGTASATRVMELAQQLMNAGANHVLLLNMPFTGDFGTAFNTTLASLVANASANVMLLDMLALFNAIDADPTTYGLTSEGRFGDCGLTVFPPHGSLSVDCDQRFYVDNGHYSATGHQIIAQAALNTVVPLPAASWFFVSGLAVLARLGKRD